MKLIIAMIVTIFLAGCDVTPTAKVVPSLKNVDVDSFDKEFTYCKWLVDPNNYIEDQYNRAVNANLLNDAIRYDRNLDDVITSCKAQALKAATT